MFNQCKRVEELGDWERESYEITRHCPGHEEENNMTVHPFSGWTLAWYVQKWYEQVPNGKASVFNKPGERDSYKEFKHF